MRYNDKHGCLIIFVLMKDSIEHETEKSVLILEKGGILLYPSDTIWGIGCDATNEAAVEKIYHLKKRSKNKSMIILLDDEKNLSHYVDHVPQQVFQILQASDKPTTIIYENGKNIARNLLPSNHSIAIRIVKDPFCLALIHKLKKPIVSTSANISDEPSPLYFRDISSAVLQGVDYVVNLYQHKNEKALPSSIIKLDNNGQFTVIR